MLSIWLGSFAGAPIIADHVFIVIGFGAKGGQHFQELFHPHFAAEEDQVSIVHKLVEYRRFIVQFEGYVLLWDVGNYNENRLVRL